MFEQAMNEALAFSNAAYLDTTDLRALYYGRPDLYVSFSDDSNLIIKTSNKEVDRPLSVVCYSVNDVVGKKVATPFFYAHVFRIPKRDESFISNIRTYSRTDLEQDLGLLRTFDYLKPEWREVVIDEMMHKTTLRLSFEKLWNITEYIAKLHSKDNYEALWRKILMDLGYTGFADPSKTGILTGKKEPAAIYLAFEERISLDILDIQKYRTDRRKRVTDKIEREVRKMSTKRNRIAKKRREDIKKSPSGSFLRDLNKMRELL